jgi:hypothetical protein
MVAPGIGVAPYALALQSLLLRHERARGTPPPEETIYFHWLNRSQQACEWFMDLLAQAERPLGRERFKLYIHLTSLRHDLTNVATFRGPHERSAATKTVKRK